MPQIIKDLFGIMVLWTFFFISFCGFMACMWLNEIYGVLASLMFLFSFGTPFVHYCNKFYQTYIPHG